MGGLVLGQLESKPAWLSLSLSLSPLSLSLSLSIYMYIRRAIVRERGGLEFSFFEGGEGRVVFQC